MFEFEKEKAEDTVNEDKRLDKGASVEGGFGVLENRETKFGSVRMGKLGCTRVGVSDLQMKNRNHISCV